MAHRSPCLPPPSIMRSFSFQYARASLRRASRPCIRDPNGLAPRRRLHLTRPPQSTSTPPTSTSPAASQSTRLDSILARLPRRLQSYTATLRNAPVHHVVAFLMLHEITAVVPLVGLVGCFELLGMGGIEEYVKGNAYTEEGVARFERYFKRKGWFGFTNEELDDIPIAVGDEAVAEVAAVMSRGVSDRGTRILLEVATAYAITKVLLVPRIAFSMWATPWFATRILAPISRLMRRGIR